ncbi:MAG: FecR domain-containing protein [Deltaproteobacteria bacterium]|nr:FecR domain-containing protein [Deltaproteobacteria bacterium]
MQKRLYVCVVLAASIVACTEEAPPVSPAPVVEKPASQPASQAASAPAAPPRPKATTGPRVLKLKGQATVDGAEAYEGMAITDKSVIETKAASQLVFTMFSGSVIAVRENAKVEIANNPDWKKAKKREWTMKMVAGAIWSFLPKGSSYEVATPNAVAGARGTIFYVQATAPDDSYVCDCDGDIELTVAGKKKNMKSKMQHVAHLAKGADKKAKSKPTKDMVGHDKAEIAELVALMDSAK